jgi:Glycosyltransferase 61
VPCKHAMCRRMSCATAHTYWQFWNAKGIEALKRCTFCNCLLAMTACCCALVLACSPAGFQRVSIRNAVQRITFQRKRADRRIHNEAALLALLRSYAPVDVVEFNASHSFEAQIETMSRTGVFVSVRAALPTRIE